MKNKNITLLALLLLGTLTVAGCGPLFHRCGPRHCKPACEMSAGQTPCQQPEDCVKATDTISLAVKR